VTGRTHTHAFRRRVSTEVVFRAMAVVAIMLAVHFLGTAILVASQGKSELPFVSLMFEAMSALATVGLSTGITPELATAGKLILCGLMLVGRLGPLTLAYALQRRRARVELRHPTASIRIG
jgi:trk system potassium uptake protein TrkH